jgi:hypothetical protein
MFPIFPLHICREMCVCTKSSVCTTWLARRIHDMMIWIHFTGRVEITNLFSTQFFHPLRRCYSSVEIFTSLYLRKHIRFKRQQYTYESGKMIRHGGELRAGRQRNRLSISSRCKRYSLVHSVQTGNDAHPISYAIVTKRSFSEVKL